MYWTEFVRVVRAASVLRHVAAFLAEHDLSDFDPKAPPPKTAAWWAVVDAGRSQEDAEIADALDRLGQPPAVTLADLAEPMPSSLSDWLQDRKNGRAIPHRLEPAGYVTVRNPDARDGLCE